MVRFAAAVVSLVLFGSSAVADSDLPFIAGVKPDRRPETAPKITEMVKDGAWYGHALTGVDAPYPASLRFLEDQGAWFTPFTRPGMNGPYDIRGWHQVK